MGSSTSTASGRAPSHLWRYSGLILHPWGPQVKVQRKSWSCTATAPGPFRESELGQSIAQAPQELWGKLETKPP